MSQEGVFCKREEKCNVCLGERLEEVVFLPKFPFTGIYCSKETKLHDFIYTGVDQGLMCCPDCGHAQLKAVIDPQLVYDNTYTHRGSISPIAKQGNEFFAGFIERLFPGKVFRRIIDIGCNDGFLLRQLEEKGKELIGIDPIWVGKNHSLSEKISVVGGFVEEVDLPNILNADDSLIVSAHTFEHIANPRNVFQSLLSHARPNTTFVVEVPSFDTLVSNRRFDQVFHQHLQYFSQASVLRLINELNCRYIAHAFNYSMWGGTMLFAFTNGSKGIKNEKYEKIDSEKVRESYKKFCNSLIEVAETIAKTPGEKFYGFGAAQMVPSLVYHVPNQLKGIHEILDDNPHRQGLKYPHLPFLIVSPKQVDLEKANVVITALDSARPILERLIKLKAKRILIPTQII